MHRSLRIATTALATGALAGSAMFASALVAPSEVTSDATDTSDVATAVVDATADADVADALEDALQDGAIATRVAALLDGSGALPAGQLYVGAAKRNLYPRPDEAAGEYWERDPAKCNQLSENFFSNAADQGDHLMTAGSAWPENPNCIYQGGFGIGPTNGVSDFDGGEPIWLDNNPKTNAVYPGNSDALGIWVRTIALSDGEDTLLLSIVDGEGWLWEYGNKGEQYGAKQIGIDIADELSAEGYPVAKEGVVLAATHTHAGPEFLGAWGFVPDWYMEDVHALVLESKRAAVRTASPAVVEVGEAIARQWNSERRDTYRSAEEQQVSWLQATDVETGEIIVTMGTYAAHPTRFGTNGNVAHPDWPGLFTKAAEQRFGGIGILFMTGLGNMSGSGPTDQMGTGLVSLIAEGEGQPLNGTDIRLTQSLWREPVTNVPLTALGVPGFADRKFDAVPASVSVGKSDSSPCTSAALYSVELPALAAWIGSDVALTTGPGELFANGTNSLKDESGARLAFPLAQANDALGYMPQSFEFSYQNQQGAGFALGGVAGVNYEDSYAIDACTGDMWLETSLDALAAIR